MNRWLPCVTALAATTCVALACSSNVPVGEDTRDAGAKTTSDGGNESSANDRGATGNLDGAACVVKASAYRNTCTVDSDCIAVPVELDACEACGSSCSTAALPKAEATRYWADADAAGRAHPGSLVESGCPLPCGPAPAPACVHGACVVGKIQCGSDVCDTFKNACVATTTPAKSGAPRTTTSACVAMPATCIHEPGCGACGSLCGTADAGEASLCLELTNQNVLQCDTGQGCDPTCAAMCDEDAGCLATCGC